MPQKPDHIEPRAYAAEPSMRRSETEHLSGPSNATAGLVVPVGEVQERFVARFDPHTDLLHKLESMRYKDAASDAKTLWLNEVLTWRDLGNKLLPTVTALTWLDDGSPWAVFTVEDVLYNVDVTADIGSENH